jgi:Ca-activated chloride channel homolog
MSFLWGVMLWLLVIPPALVLIYIIFQRRRKKYAVRYASLSLVKDAMGRGPGFRRHVPAILFLVGITAMMLAMARPVATIILPSQQGTIILTFDVSGSMRAEDIAPTRIEAAKAAARLFVDKQPLNIRIGIVSFSDVASIVQAPTTDREAIQAAINRLAPQRRTAIGSGILVSLAAIFEDAGETSASAPVPGFPLAPAQPTPTPELVEPGSYTSAVIILLSDGVSNTGPDPLEAVVEASHRGVRVYTVGMGSPEGSVLRIEGYSVRVMLDEATLKEIALETAALYFKAESETDLSNIYGDLSTRVVFKPQQTEITALFTGLAVALLLTAGVLSLLWLNRVP